MTEGTRAASLVVSSIGDYWRDQGTWPPACKDVTEISNTLGIAISTNRYLKKVSTNNEGTIKVIYKNINTQIDDNGLLLRPTVNANGSIAWTWVSSGLPDKYVPRPH